MSKTDEMMKEDEQQINVECVDEDVPFAMVPISLLRDPRLGWKSTAIMCWLISHDPKRFTITRASLDNVKTGEGRRTVDGALRELEANGYLARKQNRSTNGFGPVKWYISKHGRLTGVPITPKTTTTHPAASTETSTETSMDAQSTLPGIEYPVKLTPQKERAIRKTAEATEVGKKLVETWNREIIPLQYGNAALGMDALGQKDVEFTLGKRNTIRTRLEDPFWVANWEEALLKLKDMPFAMGKTRNSTYPSGWMATVEYFLRPGTVESIMEGKYNHWKSNKALTSDYKAVAGSIL